VRPSSFVLLITACDAGRAAEVVRRGPEVHPAADAAIRIDATPPVPDAGVATVDAGPTWPRLGTNGFVGVSLTALSSRRGIERAFPGTHVEQPSPYELLVYAGPTQLMLVRLSETAPHVAWMVDVVAPGISTTGGLEVGLPLAPVFRLAGARCETALDPPTRLGMPSNHQHRIHCALDDHVDVGAVVSGEPPQSGPELQTWIRSHAPNINSLRWDSYGEP